MLLGVLKTPLTNIFKKAILKFEKKSMLVALHNKLTINGCPLNLALSGTCI